MRILRVVLPIILMSLAVSYQACARDTKLGDVIWSTGSIEIVPGTGNDCSIRSGDESEFVLDTQPGKLFGMAYYPADGSLITVSLDATVRLYERKGKVMKLKATHTPKQVSQMREVRFTKVPGLVYVLYDDVKLRDELKKSLVAVQSYSDIHERVVLRDSARDWYGIPVLDQDETLLNGRYQLRSKDLRLSLFPDRWINVKLPEPLDKPFRSGPGDPLAQSVFAFPGRGIVCKTANGWSVHKMDGTLVKQFSTDEPDAWWTDPVLKDGSYHVCLRTGPGGITYRLDTASGKMVRVEQ